MLFYFIPPPPPPPPPRPGRRQSSVRASPILPPSPSLSSRSTDRLPWIPRSNRRAGCRGGGRCGDLAPDCRRVTHARRRCGAAVDAAAAARSHAGAEREALLAEVAALRLRLCALEGSHNPSAKCYSAERTLDASLHACFGLRLRNTCYPCSSTFEETWHAWRVFTKIPERDVFSWNVMVACADAHSLAPWTVR